MQCWHRTAVLAVLLSDLQLLTTVHAISMSYTVWNIHVGLASKGTGLLHV